MTYELTELVALAYGSLSGPERHAAFVRALAQTFRSHVVACQIDQPGHRHAPLLHYDERGLPMDDVVAAAARQPYVNPWFASPIVARLLRDGVASEEGLLDPSRLRRTEFHADILKPFDIFHSFGILLDQGSATTSVISVSRSHRVGYYTREELEIASSLKPHFRNLHLIQRKFSDDILANGIGGQHPAWSLAANGRVCGRNAIALSRDAALTVERDGKLRPSHSLDHAHFAAALAEILSGQRLHHRMPLRDKAGVPRYVAHIHNCRREAFLSWLLTDPAVAVVALQPLARDATELGTVLARMYHLTTAECRVAVKLLELESLGQVASALCRSEETVRCQLKAIFAKTGTHSQVSLVKLLYALTT